MTHATGFRALALLAAMLLGMSTANAAKSAAELQESVLLTAKVKAALITDENTKTRQIHIETYRGIIQLSGVVGNSEEKVQAERLAASVPGVLEVRNALEIRQRLADEEAGIGSGDATPAAVETASIADESANTRQIDVASDGDHELQISPAR